MLGIRAQSLRYTVPKSLCSPILFAAVALAPVLVLLAVGHGGVFEGGNLSKNDIRLYLDGAEQRRFSYSRATGKLSYHPTCMLPAGTHTVEIAATGEQGLSTARKNWAFTVAQ
jgi:hypothetical protein